MNNLIIKSSKGYELEKEKPNTSEDFFNRSEVVYEENGQTNTLHVLYVRFFEESLGEYTPFSQDPIVNTSEFSVTLKEVVALICLLQDDQNKNRKRVYINTQAQFAALFKDVDWARIKDIMTTLKKSQHVEV